MKINNSYYYFLNPPPFNIQPSDVSSFNFKLEEEIGAIHGMRIKIAK